MNAHLSSTNPASETPDVAKFYRITETAYIFGGAAHFLIGFIFLWFRIFEMAWFNFAFSVPVFSTAFAMNRRGLHGPAFALAFSELITHQVAAVHYVGLESGFQYYLIYVSGLVFFNANWKNLVRYCLLGGIAAIFTVLHFAFKIPVYSLSAVQLDFLFLSSTLTTLTVLSLLIRHYVQVANSAEAKLVRANKELSARNDQIARILADRDRALESLNRELSEAAEYVKAALPSPLDKGEVKTSWRFIPSSSLGGDAFGYHWLDARNFALYLVDVSGHGVGAALLSVSIMNTLRSESLVGVDFKNPGEVLGALNTMFPGEENNFMSFTAWYGVYDTCTRNLIFASGGHPPALLLTGTGANVELKKLGSRNITLGVIRDVIFITDTCRIEPGDMLYLFSDGVYELHLMTGKMWMLEEFAEFLRSSKLRHGSRLESIERHVRTISGEIHEDDFTIVEFLFEEKESAPA